MEELGIEGMNRCSESFRFTALSFAFGVICVGGLRGEDLQSSDAQLVQGEVVEVSGKYAKVALVDAGIEKGDKAELVRSDESPAAETIGTVTAVEPKYIVVKFGAVAPRKGDVVRFAAKTARTPDAAVDPSDKVQVTPERKSSRETLQERRARQQAEREKKQEEVRQKWLARLEARGVEPWSAATDEEHEEALAKYKKMGEEVQALLPGVQLYETKYFLFYSNMPPDQVAPYIRYLDAMYVMMGSLFGVPEDQDVWVGRKAPVFAFLSQQQFLAFEQRYFQVAPAGAYGICHQSPATGEVVIACYRGDDPHDFGQMLVHETSHGFVFRYKTKANLPVWVDEGMAEYIGEKMVPTSDAVRNKEQAALVQLKQTRRLGANFFDEDASLAGWQYGVATNMNKFLLARGQQRYVAFIEGMKEGMTWQESLREAYGATPEEFVLLYGAAIGVGGLGL
jgi:hypothetical protein